MAPIGAGMGQVRKGHDILRLGFLLNGFWRFLDVRPGPGGLNHREKV